MTRIGYWVLKFLALLAMFAAVVGAVYGVAVLATFVCGWFGAHLTAIKRGIYSACTIAIFFYTACAIRAVARYFSAKADHQRRQP